MSEPNGSRHWLASVAACCLGVPDFADQQHEGGADRLAAQHAAQALHPVASAFARHFGLGAVALAVATVQGHLRRIFHREGDSAMGDQPRDHRCAGSGGLSAAWASHHQNQSA